MTPKIGYRAVLFSWFIDLFEKVTAKRTMKMQTSIKGVLFFIVAGGMYSSFFSK